MDLNVNELKLLLFQLEREKISYGLTDEESDLMIKLEKRYKELGGYVKEIQQAESSNLAPWEG
ncbi:hypothetical protein [Paenibacillus sp. XY044]|uniref:hypothetical protein n=1 Tax=Paenibacillus sp. XY044 TaxID=2026089 RepID=UPI000B98AEB2|nr:hypothetical protein [Paenibacillus sp. XY044]OZB98088.1 hypothetical protein CJP46_02670 [Paenibacillus sp. XY044]